ncbi:MAG: hypothetical protein NZ902_05820 [Acidilobaceae archaeon]|nr:hypothetical protein [Acidilobaceae archaeon]MDW7974725.1 hypothetical protein [Sulfolobales archaeon]
MLEACVDIFMKTYSRLRILGGNIEMLEGQLPPRNPREVVAIVKGMKEVSVDEVPLLNALNSALPYAGLDVKYYEYDSVLAERSRYESFAIMLEQGLKEGLGLIVMAPYLMPLGVLSKLSEEAIGILDSATSYSVTVKYENLLYLPERADHVELIGKENSSTSQERVEWLRGEAERRGLRVTTKFLRDNKAIFEYVMSAGPRGIYKRVPTTKLSSYLIAIARCYELAGIDEIVRTEESRHMIYMINMPQNFVEGYLTALKGELKTQRVALLREPYLTWVSQGSFRVLREIIRRYGL